jgi:hypothetical protein
MSRPARVAVYFAPAPDSPWWQFGCSWLGRDALTDVPKVQPVIPGIDLPTLTAAARRYGFHATLKAPFELAATADLGTLDEQLRYLVRRLPPLPLNALRPALLSGFVALRPPTALHARLERFAIDCVTSLDHLRAPWDPAELERRGRDQDARGRELLLRWGYPYVFERFRFHMTLSAAVDPADAQRLIDAVSPATDRLAAEHPPVLDRLCLFTEAAPGMPMLRVADYRLEGRDDAVSGVSAAVAATSRSSDRQ